MNEQFNRKISEAINNDEKDIVTRLLQEIEATDVNTDIKIYNPYNGDRFETITPLHLAVANDLFEAAKSLLKNGANINGTATIGVHEHRTPLALAVDNNNFEMVKLLLKHKADVNIAPPEGADIGKTPLWLAAFLNNNEIIKLLLANGANANIAPTIGRAKKLSPLLLTTRHDNLEIVELLLKQNVDINAVSTEGPYKGETPLFIAVGHHQSEIAKILVAKHANVNIANVEGVTPVMLATSNGNFELVEFLVRHGAEVVNLESENWKKALHNAKTIGAHKCVDFIENAHKTGPLVYMLAQRDREGKGSPISTMHTDLIRRVKTMLTGEPKNSKPKKPQPN